MHLNQPRYGFIDCIKAIAALMIVIYHFSEAEFLQFEFIPDGAYIPSVGKCLLGLCSAGVPLFFMVNGFLTSNKDYGLKKTLLKVFNILKIYFFWGTIICLLISPDRLSFGLLWQAIKTNVWIFWFFKTLAFLYLFNFAVHRLPEKWSTTVKTLIFSGLLLFPFLSNLLWVIAKLILADISVPTWGHTGVFTLYSIVYYLLPSIVPSSLRLSNPVSILLIAIGLALNFLEVYVYSNAYLQLIDNVNGLFPTIGALCISVGVWCLIKNNYKADSTGYVRLVNWIGSNALGVYIFHIPLIYALKNWFQPPMNPALGIIACIMIAILASLINTLIKKTPCIRWLIKI